MGERIEPVWMRTLRGQARERFAAMSWPATTEEEWRRTDVSRLGMEGFAPAPAPKAACPRDVDVADVPAGFGAAAGFIRFEAGQCTELALAEQWKDAGVRLLPLELALEEFETPLYRLFQGALKETDNKFMAWHYGEWSHGAFLWVPGRSRNPGAFPHRHGRAWLGNGELPAHHGDPR